MSKQKVIVTPFQKIVITFAIITLLVLLPIENFLRFKYRNLESNSYRYTVENFDPFLQFKLTDSYTTHINSYGFRGSEIKKQKPANTYRIFVLGGSTVLNSGTEYEKTSARMLEKLLQKHYPDKQIEVINAGIDGYTSEHSLIQYLFNIKDFKPDLVIMWHGINDWYYSCSPSERANGEFKPDYTHFWGANASMAKKYFKPQPLVTLKFLTYDFFMKFLQDNWYSDLFKWNQAKNPFPGYYTDSSISKQYEMNDVPSLSSYKRNLLSIIQATKADNVPLVLGNQPFLYKNNLSHEESRRLYIPVLHCTIDGKYPSITSTMKTMEQFNKATEQIAEEKAVSFIDLNTSLPKTLDYFTDDVHYTDKGNAKIADTLFQFIMSNNLLQ